LGVDDDEECHSADEYDAGNLADFEKNCACLQRLWLRGCGLWVCAEACH
jgi:hypothetical protein